MPKDPKVSQVEYMNISDIARARKVTRQTVTEQWHDGRLPKADGFMGARRAPIWKRLTLERAGVIPESAK